VQNSALREVLFSGFYRICYPMTSGKLNGRVQHSAAPRTGVIFSGQHINYGDIHT